MPTPRKRQHLRLGQFAEAAGFTKQSLAAMTGLNPATLTRHWNKSDWAGRVEGPTLLLIAACVPGVAEAVTGAALGARLDSAREDIEAAGCRLNDGAIEAAQAGGVVPQFLHTGLVAVGKLLTDQVDAAENALRSCWGREQSRALDVAFGNHAVWQALDDSTPAIEAARRAFEDLSKRNAFPYGRCIAIGDLCHQVGKATGELLALPQEGRTQGEWNAGHYVRGAFMGKLRHDLGSVKLADEYHEVVLKHDNAHAVERWAFPSWVGDVPPADGFFMPEEPKLIRTAAEILDELENYNDTYVYYLAKTFVPLALEELDPQFGGRRADLVSALQGRAERIPDPLISEQLRATAHLAAKSQR